ncbi:hypothetical protein B7486_12370 [cyanobacterium TDX16]|nr:hypothetical protein B7486_12370 [cyanobacterium TDX16]
MIFNFEWWFDASYRDRVDEAKRRCALLNNPTVDPEKAEENKTYRKFYEELEHRTIIYLRDGFSYELKDLIPSRSTAALTFECAPVDDLYRVGAFVVTIPFEEIVRVEVFACHPKEKPEDMPSIKGFGGAQSPHAPPGPPGPPKQRTEDRPPRREGLD